MTTVNLTKSEQEAYKYHNEGYRTGIIAEKMGVSPQSAYVYLCTAKKKIKINKEKQNEN